MAIDVTETAARRASARCVGMELRYVDDMAVPSHDASIHGAVLPADIVPRMAMHRRDRIDSTALTRVGP